jgi:hypothetical protein
MAVSHEYPGGVPGAVEAEIVPSRYADPYVEASAALGRELRDQAKVWASGAASAPPNRLHEYAIPEVYVPQLVRVGTLGENGPPVLLPLERSVAFGSPDYLVPKKLPVPRLQLDIKAALRDRAEVQDSEDGLNRARFANLRAERERAVNVMTGIMARAVASVQPGWLRLTTCHPTAPDTFASFAALSQKGLCRAVGNTPALLKELASDVHARQAALAGYPSLRALTELGKVRPTLPWHIVSLVGNYKNPLSKDDQHLFNYILQFGADVGVMVLYHGLKTSTTAEALQHRVHLLARGRAASSAVGELIFVPDAPPPPDVVARVCQTAAQQATPRAPARLGEQAPAERIPTQRELTEYAATTPGVAYRAVVAARVREERRARFTVAEHAQDFPFHTARALRIEVPHSIVTYQHMVRDLLAGDRAARELVRAAENPNAHTIPLAERLAILAAANMVESAPGRQPGRLTKFFAHPAITRNIDQHFWPVADLVATTRHHGQRRLGEMAPYVAHLAPNDPPAWAFEHLVNFALRSTHEGNRLAGAGALCTDLEHRFQVQLRDAEGNIADRALFGRLIEYRRLELNGFDDPATPPEVQELFIMGAERNRLSTDEAGLPQTALALHRRWVIRREALMPPEEPPATVALHAGNLATEEATG